MNFSFEQIAALVISKTGKSITGFSPVVLNSSELREIFDQEEPAAMYFGTIELVNVSVAPDNNGLCFMHAAADLPTNLSVNKLSIHNGYRRYENIMFDKLTGYYSEDSEMSFSGYKFNLI